MHSNEKSYLKKLIIFQLFFFPLRCPGRCKNASQFFRVKDNSNLYCLGFHQDRWPESPGPTSPTNQTVQDFPTICYHSNSMQTSLRFEFLSLTNDFINPVNFRQ